MLGHSQGAILIAALLALRRTPFHPSVGYIMNGVSFPNPYARQLESLSKDDNGGNDNDGDRSCGSPKVLFVFGRRDKITPNSSGEQLRDLLAKGGVAVSSCYHDGGHGFPEEDEGDEVMRMITEWILLHEREK